MLRSERMRQVVGRIGYPIVTWNPSLILIVQEFNCRLFLSRLNFRHRVLGALVSKLGHAICAVLAAAWSLRLVVEAALEGLLRGGGDIISS